jgi:phage terminase large subunit
MNQKIKPSDFCRIVLGESPYDLQAEIMDSLLESKRIAVAAANGVGKTWAAARIAAWFLICIPQSLVVTTAPTYRQVRFLIWRELAAIYQNLKTKFPGRDFGKCVSTRWETPGSSLALGFAASEYKVDRFQGLHAPNLLVIVDEASGISDAIYEQILATLRGKNSYLFMIGNPLRSSGPFADAFLSGTFKTFKISAFDSPNVKAGKVVVPGLVTLEDIERDRRLFGEDSVYWRTRILAEFPEEEEGALFSLGDILNAQYLERDPSCPIEAGFDPASGSSGSSSVIVFRQGPAAYRLETLTAKNLMEMAEKAHSLILEEHAARVKVDALGLSAGVADRLAELASGLYEVIPIRGSEKSVEGYVNLRTEMWVYFAELVKRGQAGGPVFADRRVVNDLLTIQLEISPSGKLGLSKKSYGRPTFDFGDALVYAFWNPGGVSDLESLISVDFEPITIPKESPFVHDERPWKSL